MALDNLAGTGLLQSRAEWAHRNRILSSTLAELVNSLVERHTEQGIDVGCQDGALTDAMPEATVIPKWTGVDPAIRQPTLSPSGAQLLPGAADSIPFPDQSFDVALFANVYEHVLPDRRTAS